MALWVGPDRRSTLNGDRGHPKPPRGAVLKSTLKNGRGSVPTRRARMSDKEKDELLHDHNNDGVNRRGFLKCMAWAGTGAFCVMQGGVLKSYSLSRLSEFNAAEANGELSFVQISDSHMGFNKPANPDVAGTLKAAVDKINGLTTAPEFMLHTGDISHLSKPEEFDTVDQILKSAAPKDVFYVPGEHDVLNDDGKRSEERRVGK